MLATRRQAAVAAALGMAAVTFAAAPASAHGTMGDPVSRVAQCYAENPESPKSDACRAAVAAGGTQALYDWNGIRIGDADGRHQTIEHGGHGDDDASTSADPTADRTVDQTADQTGAPARANAPEQAGSPGTTALAATGGDGSTPYLAIGGAAALALGSSALFLSVRRRAPRR
ncbi:lytic polysaccharide monooxygenase [Streptomyces sp. NPDC048281]|uniref:lytic polysaccharide monooxygenase n=1 Tax=Streptomyces sp. NPDC048281 TaxID=3154715 RepID=UPI00343B943B